MSGKEVRIIKASDIITWHDISKKDMKRESVYSKKSFNSKFIVDENLNKKICVIKADLTRISVDAVVTPASSNLLGGGGIDGEIHRIAGPDLARECKKLEGCDIGDAKITSGYLLPATFIIHTVPPKGINEEILTKCYSRSLTVAEGEMGNAAPGRRNSVLSKEGSLSEASRQNTLTDADLQGPAPRALTQEEINHLTRTWKLLEDDIAKVGVITFISLFETHPDVQQVFMPFNGIELEDLKHSKQLRAHALRVMAFVQKAIARLQEPEKLEQLLKELGRKHNGYKAKVQYVDLVGPQFFQAIQPSLGEEWTEEVATAWKLLFAHVGYVMKGAMIEAAEEAARGNK